MGPEDSRCLVRELPQGRPSQFHRAMQGRSPETGIERLLLLAKRIQQGLGAQHPDFLRVFSHFHSKFQDTTPSSSMPSFVNLHCNSATYVRF